MSTASNIMAEYASNLQEFDVNVDIDGFTLFTKLNDNDSDESILLVVKDKTAVGYALVSGTSHANTTNTITELYSVNDTADVLDVVVTFITYHMYAYHVRLQRPYTSSMLKDINSLHDKYDRTFWKTPDGAQLIYDPIEFDILTEQTIPDGWYIVFENIK